MLGARIVTSITAQSLTCGSSLSVLSCSEDKTEAIKCEG